MGRHKWKIMLLKNKHVAHSPLSLIPNVYFPLSDANNGIDWKHAFCVKLFIDVLNKFKKILLVE